MRAVILAIAGMLALMPAPAGWAGEEVALTSKAMVLLDQGKEDEALELLRQAKRATPNDPIVHLNYASVLFYRGKDLIEAGKNTQGRMLFKEVQRELELTMTLADDSADGRAIKGQCAFLLGDTALYAFEDSEQATMWYEKSLEYNPAQEHVARALAKLKQPAPPTGSATH